MYKTASRLNKLGTEQLNFRSQALFEHGQFSLKFCYKEFIVIYAFSICGILFEIMSIFV